MSQLPTYSDACAPQGTCYIGSDHGGEICYKDAMSNVQVISTSLGVNVVPDAAPITLDLSVSRTIIATLTAGGNRVLQLANVPTAAPWTSFTLLLTQGGGGSNTVTWFGNLFWPGGVVPTLTTTAGKTDWFEFLQLPSGIFLGTVRGQNF